MKGGKFCFGPLLFHLLECAPMSHCTQPAHMNAPKALALSATAFSSCFKIFHMKHVKHVPLSFSGEKKQKTTCKGTFLFHLLLIMNIACAAFICTNNFSTCLIAHHFLFSKRLLYSEIFSFFKLHPF